MVAILSLMLDRHVVTIHRASMGNYHPGTRQPGQMACQHLSCLRNCLPGHLSPGHVSTRTFVHVLITKMSKLYCVYMIIIQTKLTQNIFLFLLELYFRFLKHLLILLPSSTTLNYLIFSISHNIGSKGHSNIILSSGQTVVPVQLFQDFRASSNPKTENDLKK